MAVTVNSFMMFALMLFLEEPRFKRLFTVEIPVITSQKKSQYCFTAQTLTVWEMPFIKIIIRDVEVQLDRDDSLPITWIQHHNPLDK